MDFVDVGVTSIFPMLASIPSALYYLHPHYFLQEKSRSPIFTKSTSSSWTSLIVSESAELKHWLLLCKSLECLYSKNLSTFLNDAALKAIAIYFPFPFSCLVT